VRLAEPSGPTANAGDVAAVTPQPLGGGASGGSPAHETG
jgi:hypothetical protein